MAEIISKNGKACLFKMTDKNIELYITNWGASIFLVRMDGEDITLSCDDLESFMQNKAFFGATVGRTVNRINKGRFTLNGKEYQLTINENSNSAHGGAVSFAHKIWDYEIISDNKVKFSLFSPDGEEGYPGNLNTSVTYELKDGRITIIHEGDSDKDTLMSYTNHTYWALCGPGAKIYDELLTLSASKYLETTKELIPTGNIYSVEGTPFDFREPHRIGERIFADHPSTVSNRGYDLSFVREGNGPAAVLQDNEKKRVLEVYTTYPDIHIYSGNFLDGDKGRGRNYEKHDAMCLEGCFFPDAVNHPNFGGMVLKAGEHRKETIIYALYNK